MSAPFESVITIQEGAYWERTIVDVKYPVGWFEMKKDEREKWHTDCAKFIKDAINAALLAAQQVGGDK